MVRAYGALPLSLLLAALATLRASPTRAADRWEAPMPGVRLLTRTTRTRDDRQVIIHAAHIDLCTPGFSFRVSAPDEGRRFTSTWARNVNAVAAVNGDFFDGNPMRPLGPARGRGVWWPVRRQYFFGGWLASGLNRNISLFDIHAAAGTWSTAIPDTEVLSFQEHMVVEGQVRLSEYVTHGGRAPRTGVGFTHDKRTMILVAIDGRTSSSIGATTAELARHMIELGVWEGVRLDGGGSTTLFVRGPGVVNHLEEGHERVVANHAGIVIVPNAPLPSFCTGS